MNLDKLFESAAVELNEKRAAAYETGGMKKVVVEKDGKKYEFHFTDNFENIPDEKSLRMLASKMSRKLGLDDVQAVVRVMKSIKNKEKAFSDDKTDLKIVDGKVELVEDVINEAPTLEMVAVKGKMSPDVWKNNGMGPEITEKLKKFVISKFGKDTIADDSSGPDIEFIKDGKFSKFIISFERGPRAGKKLEIGYDKVAAM